ncbi:MAG: acetate--CoA ligase family protein [Minwuia sp.]|uniref:acetate--CoA ligase family protein n=1 Tax=Minwuia sp. TaxID=2493630 RepID=UPI003A85C758
MAPDIGAYLSPKSVAVIGASGDDTILRGRLMKVLTSQPFPGAIWPISRSADEVMGLKAYRSVADTPEPADLAIVIVPAEFVPAVLRDCGEAGVKSAHIITSGFAEEPGGAGARLQDEIREIAERYRMVVVGPNSQGFMNTRLNLTATFSPAARHFQGALIPEYRKDGFVTVVAQSGGLGFSLFDHGRPRGLPFNYVVTTGNEAALEHLDIVDHLLDTGETEVFLIFMEDIKTPEKLKAVGAKALRAGKPLIVARAGRSEAGERAAASHTAALAGSDSAYRAIFERYGIIECNELEEMVDLAAGFSHMAGRLPAGRRVAVTTSSGGAGGLLADALSEAGLELPVLDDATRAEIDQHLPAYGSSQNPVDATAQAVRQLGHFRLNMMVAASPAIDAIVCITTARDGPAAVTARPDLERLRAECPKPVIFCSYTAPAEASIETFAGCGIPLYWNMRHCARTLSEMARYREVRERFLEPAGATAVKHTAIALPVRDRVLTEAEAGPLLAGFGLPWAGGALAGTAEAAQQAAKTMAGPVAMKIQSPDILHKTEAGGVRLNVEAVDAAEAYGALLTAAAAYNPNATIQGVLVQPMTTPGVEVILGLRRDPQFGLILMAGLGGVLVEVLKDVVFVPLPVTSGEARHMLDRLKGRALLDGLRGAPPADVDALCRTIEMLSRFAEALGDGVDEIDLNPVIVHPHVQGVTIADALILPSGCG